MKFTILLMILVVTGMTGLAGEAIWDTFYEMAGSREEAEATSLDSTDAQALKKAGVYYFALVNGVNSVKIDKKNRVDNAKTAMDYFEAAYTQDRKNPELGTWRATSTLSYAGAVKKLSIKIKYSNMGISYYNQVPTGQRNNLDYLAMRIISYSQVPKSFKNLTDIVKSDAENYMTIYNSLTQNPGTHEYLKETVKVMHAYAYFITGKRDIAKKHVLTVDEDLLLRGQGADTTTADYFFRMKKKLKIK